MKTFEEIKKIFDELNNDLSHHTSRDDICTPMDCVKTMIDYVPIEIWDRKELKILDACCGNGNFGAYCSLKTNLDNIYFNDLNEIRLQNCKNLLNPSNIMNNDILSLMEYNSYDLIVANPPYSGGGNKNQSLSNKIIRHCIGLLKDNSYLCFVTPNNWMTYNNDNKTLKDLLNNGYFVVIDNDVKKYFPSVGSSFTIFVWKKTDKKDQTLVKNNYLIKDEQCVTIPSDIPFIPLYMSQEILDIIGKTLSVKQNMFNYRCDLHNFTQKLKLSDEQDNTFKYETIHTARKTRYAICKQDIYDKWNIIIPLSTYFIPYVRHNVNVTQSVGYISFDDEDKANKYLEKLNQDWVKVLIHLTRYGNFNNIMVLKHLKYDENILFTENEYNTIQMLRKHIKY